jgi:hypothetical protein
MVHARRVEAPLMGHYPEYRPEQATARDVPEEPVGHEDQVAQVVKSSTADARAIDEAVRIARQQALRPLGGSTMRGLGLGPVSKDGSIRYFEEASRRRANRERRAV